MYTWQAYADSVQAHPGWHPFSYLNNSYHRDADPQRMRENAVALLLSPGVAQIFYGDETGRELSEARLNVDSDQAFRSDMNWDDADVELLAHFRRLGRIRRENPVIGTGRQRTIDTHTCLRYNGSERLLIRILPEAGKPIAVAGIFPDGTRLEELYTGAVAEVRDGAVTFPAYPGGVALLRARR